MTTTIWSRANVAVIADHNSPCAPLIDPAAIEPLLPGLDLWDHWPVQMRDGRIADIAGGALMMFLSAPADGDPDARHAIARLRLMHRTSAGWRDLGLVLPDGLSPGSREWAGSAILSDDGAGLTLYFTAAGRRGEETLSFEQRLFEMTAIIRVNGDDISLSNWSAPLESIVADGAIYMRNMAGGGAIGTIKAFRDPSYFRDPSDGCEYLLFSGSLGNSNSNWNGAIGAARRNGGAGWSLLPPLVTADGLNNELERPHVVVAAGRYYLFWSSQRKVFADGGPSGPNGLYGMVGDSLDGPWSPLNDTGLVFANPSAAPFQAYSWLVLPDLSVLSFVDIVGLDRMPRNAAEARAHFGGTPAPTLNLRLDGCRIWLE